MIQKIVDELKFANRIKSTLAGVGSTVAICYLLFADGSLPFLKLNSL